MTCIHTRFTIKGSICKVQFYSKIGYRYLPNRGARRDSKVKSDIGSPKLWGTFIRRGAHIRQNTDARFNV